MFLKIVTTENTFVLEANSFSYRIQKNCTGKQLEKYWEDCSMSTLTRDYPSNEDGSDKADVLIITAQHNKWSGMRQIGSLEGVDHLHYVGLIDEICDVYLLNNDGKTIDKPVHLQLKKEERIIK